MHEKDVKNCKISTKLVRGGTKRSNFCETSEALYLNSGFCSDSAEEAAGRFTGTHPGYAYGRYTHPNLQMLEERLALMEGAERAIVMASGMAAVTGALLSQLKTGDRVVASKALFSSCHYVLTELLPRFGIETELVDGSDLTQWEQALSRPAKCVFIETPANPTLELIDIPAVAKLCKANDTLLMVDNVFATPMGQHPLQLGADVVIYSTTKHIDGQGRTFGGVILGKKEFMEETVLPFHRHTGPHMSPFNAWLLLKSLETLPLRVERHCSNAQALAEVLQTHNKIARLIYPGLPSHPQHAIAKKQMTNGGPMLAFEMKGGREAAFRFMNALKLIDISNNLGDAKTLVTCPAATTHHSLGEEIRAQMGISDGLIRMSVGIEDIEDLTGDIAQALTKA